jgi:hypothetical protein
MDMKGGCSPQNAPFLRLLAESCNKEFPENWLQPPQSSEKPALAGSCFTQTNGDGDEVIRSSL